MGNALLTQANVFLAEHAHQFAQLAQSHQMQNNKAKKEPPFGGSFV